MQLSEAARTKLGIPFTITSWIRCEEHNREIGGVSGSSHIKGKAVDIAFSNDHEKYTIIAYLMWAGFRRIGVSDKESFIHVDIDDEKPTPAVWVY